MSPELPASPEAGAELPPLGSPPLSAGLGEQVAAASAPHTPAPEATFGGLMPHMVPQADSPGGFEVQELPAPRLDEPAHWATGLADLPAQGEHSPDRDAPADTGRGRRSRRRARSRRRTLVLRSIAGVSAAAAIAVGVSIAPYVTQPGTDSLAARLSGWARDHHLGAVVNQLEKVQYDLHKPRTGGAPVGGIPTAAPEPSPTAPAPSAPPAVPHSDEPAPVTPLAGPALANEGVWQTLVTAQDLPAMRATFIRPDSVHTSYLTALAWLDPKLLSFQLHPGSVEPGSGPWQTSNHITAEALPQMVAAFNSGFKLEGARGGYFSEERLVRPLRVGAASLVIHADGTPDVIQWGREASSTAGFSSVRQNLDLLVDNGQLADNLDENNTPRWGFTLGNKTFVWRSGVGVTASGAIVYAAGNSLSVKTLAQVLQAAGAVRAMELDINPEWTTCYWFGPDTSGGPVIPHKLAPDMQKSADRYLQTSQRDFITAVRR